MGYDSKSVKVPKQVKRFAANFLDNHRRRQFIRSYVRILEDENLSRTTRNRKNKGD